MDSDNKAHNYWFLIAQAQKIDSLPVLVSDEDPIHLQLPIYPKTYRHYFYTLLITSQELTFP